MALTLCVFEGHWPLAWLCVFVRVTGGVLGSCVFAWVTGNVPEGFEFASITGVWMLGWL